MNAPTNKGRVWSRATAVFSSHGYSLHNPQTLVPKGDPTLLLTNSTIATFRPLLLQKRPWQGKIATVQDCIRSHNLKSYIRSLPTSDLGFLSYFDMIGSLEDGAISGRHVALVQDLLLAIGLDLRRVAVVVNPSDDDAFSALADMMPDAAIVKLATHEYPEWTRWTYGTPGLSGYGMSFFYPSPGMDRVTAKNLSKACSLGNIIEIRTTAHNFRHVELAFGLNCLAVAETGLPIVEVSHTADVMARLGAAKGIQALADCLVTVAVLLGNGVASRPKGVGNLLRQYVKCALQSWARLGLTPADLATGVESASRATASRTSMEQDALAAGLTAELEAERTRADRALAAYRGYLQRNANRPEADLINIGKSTFGQAEADARAALTAAVAAADGIP